MYKKKVYGQSRSDFCPFCNKKATVTNKDGLYVCREHVNKQMEAIVCTCGEYLDQRSGKFGPYFNCFNCGNISFAKGMELKQLGIKKKKKGIFVDGEFIINIENL